MSGNGNCIFRIKLLFKLQIDDKVVEKEFTLQFPKMHQDGRVYFAKIAATLFVITLKILEISHGYPEALPIG